MQLADRIEKAGRFSVTSGNVSDAATVTVSSADWLTVAAPGKRARSLLGFSPVLLFID